MYCSNCGTKVQEGSKFCNNCGMKISDNTTTEKIENKAVSEIKDDKNSISVEKTQVSQFEEKKSKKSTYIIGGIVAFFVLGTIGNLIGPNTDNPKNSKPTKQVKKISEIPNAHRDFMSKIGLTVPSNDKVEFGMTTDGKLSYYIFEKQNDKQGKVYVDVNKEGAIEKLNVGHVKEGCISSFSLVENGKVLGDLNSKLAEHIKQDEKDEEERKQREAKARAEEQALEAKIQKYADYLGCSVEDYKNHFDGMLNAGYNRGRLTTWYNDSSSTSINTYGIRTQYVLHLVGRGQNGNKVYVNVYEYSDKPGQYQYQVMNTNHE